MEPTIRPIKKIMSDTDIKKILDEHKNNPGKMQKVIAEEFGCAPSTVCKILKNANAGDNLIVQRPTGNLGLTSHKVTGRAMHLPGKQNGEIGENICIIKPKAKTEPVIMPTGITKASGVGRHAAIPHKLNFTYKNLDRQELAFLKAAPSCNDFVVAYFKHFGFDMKTSSMLNEVWKRREDILKYEIEKENHAIAKPTATTIVEPMKTRDRESMVDDDRLLISISNAVSELIELQKETLAMHTRVVKLLGIPASA